MIKITDDMIEAGQQALVDDGWDKDDALLCDLKYVFSAMYEAANNWEKSEKMQSIIDAQQRKLESLNKRVKEFADMAMKNGIDDMDRAHKLRMMAMDNGYCMLCGECHIDGFCDADE